MNIYIYISCECRGYALGIGVVINPNLGPSNCIWTASSSLLLTVHGREPPSGTWVARCLPFQQDAERLSCTWGPEEDADHPLTSTSSTVQLCPPPPSISICPCTSGLFKKCSTFSLVRLLQEKNCRTELVSGLLYSWSILLLCGW